MVWFSPTTFPGWIDYVGLALTLAGFIAAFIQLFRVKRAADAAKAAATNAIEAAQRALSQRSILFLAPQVQLVVEDLDYAMPKGDVQVARRALVRFAHLAREASELVRSISGDTELANRLSEAAEKATKSKGALMRQSSPDVTAVAKGAASVIDTISHELTAIAASMKNTVEGDRNV